MQGVSNIKLEVQNLMHQKNPYTRHENEAFILSRHELFSFLGINFFMGYHERLRGDVIGLLTGPSTHG
jgi:hypothetical protein